MASADARSRGLAVLGAIVAASGCTVFNGLEAAPSDASPSDASADYRARVLADEPLVYLRLDEGQGNVAKDASGRGHDGVYKGTTFVPSGALPDNGAIELDGQSSVDLGTSAEIAFGGAQSYTLEAWLRTKATGFQKIMSRDDGNVPNRRGHHLFFRKGTLGATVEIGAERMASPGTTCESIAPAAVDRFVHVAATFDGTTLRTYVDGEPGKLSSSACPDLQELDIPLVLGLRPDGSNGFEGTLDEVAIYGAALSEERIRAHHDAVASP